MDESVDRRTMVGLLALGMVAILSGCSDDDADEAGGPGKSAKPTPKKAAPAKPRVLWKSPPAGRRIALTIDDGYDAATVAGYVAFAKTTGIPITFSPNGAFQRVWNAHAAVLRPLIEAGQVQIGNHTFGHKDLTKISPKAAANELKKNEKWIRKTFGTSSLPYYRPPYGARNPRTDQLAADLGFSSILMWNGTFDDQSVVSHKHIMKAARNGMKPGSIIVGHANHPPVLKALDDIQKLMKQRDLHPVTLDTMFATKRPALT